MRIAGLGRCAADGFSALVEQSDPIARHDTAAGQFPAPLAAVLPAFDRRALFDSLFCGASAIFSPGSRDFRFCHVRISEIVLLLSALCTNARTYANPLFTSCCFE